MCVCRVMWHIYTGGSKGDQGAPWKHLKWLIVACPPLNLHDLSNFWWAPFGCYSILFSPATSPTGLTLALHGQPKCGWLLGNFSITSASISMMMMMWWQIHHLCWEDARTSNQTVAMRHGIHLYCAQGPGKYFGLIRIFVAWYLAK
jgi:hypothetical protein